MKKAAPFLFLVLAFLVFFPYKIVLADFGAAGANLTPYVSSINNDGSGNWRISMDSAFFGSSFCTTTFSSISGVIANDYSRPSGSRIDAYSGGISGGPVNPTWVCTTGNVFTETDPNVGSGPAFSFGDATYFSNEGNGTYYINYCAASTCTSSSSLAYIAVIWNGSVASVTPSDTTTGIFNFDPDNGAVVDTTGTGDVTISFDYYLDSESAPSDVDEVCARGERVDSPGEFEICAAFLGYDSEENFSELIEGLPLDSQWEWRVFFLRPGFFIDEFETTSRGTTSFFISRFSVDSSAGEIYDAYTDCSITDIAGCLQNVIVFLFYPTSGSLSSFRDLYATFEDKPPFGYLSAVKSALEGLNTTETAAFTLQSMDVIDTYIFDPMRTALVAILWLAFAFMFFHRLKNLQL